MGVFRAATNGGSTSKAKSACTMENYCVGNLKIKIITLSSKDFFPSSIFMPTEFLWQNQDDASGIDTAYVVMLFLYSFLFLSLLFVQMNLHSVFE